MAQIVIDHKERVLADDCDCFNEIRTLDSLRFGLYQLAATVSSYEDQQRKSNSEKLVCTFSFGDDPHIPQAQRLVLPCFFHWFAVTLCNYARLVGLVRGLEKGHFFKSDLANETGHKKIRDGCNAYVKSVSELRPIQLWRNKVAAHPAITDPRSDDNIATLDLSVFYPIGYLNGRFCVNLIQITKTGTDGVEHSSELPPWSLTEAWNALRPRYWPDLALIAETTKGGCH